VTLRGRFISLEGGEGVGKSTQVSALATALRDRGIDVLVTREPGGSEGAERIRELLLSGNEDRWGPEAEALLFATARADHLAKTIRPALEAGRWVLSDRFVDSSLAYQGGAGGLGIEAVRAINAFGIGEDFPDRAGSERQRPDRRTT
jgi:dTMP kinase